MLNKVVLMGRLVRDPELRHTQSNTPVASFRLAVDRGVRRDAGNPQQQTADFVDIVCWERRAEFAQKWFRKGQLVALAGRLQQREWTDRDGNRRNTIEVVADELHFAERSGEGAGAYPPSPAAAYAGAPAARDDQNTFPEPALPAPSSGFAELEDDGELPF